MDPNNNFQKAFLETVDMKRKADMVPEAKEHKQLVCPLPSGNGGGETVYKFHKNNFTINQ